MQLASRAFDWTISKRRSSFVTRTAGPTGSPVVPPTPRAVERIVDYLGREPDEVIGVIPPRNGVATIEKIAINCVMAGCKPEVRPRRHRGRAGHARGAFQPERCANDHALLCAACVVSGPIVKTLGFNTKEGAFGHGCRASATIGRAIRLVLWNVGGGFPGEPCKTTHGHPGYYSFCLAEDPERIPGSRCTSSVGSIVMRAS